MISQARCRGRTSARNDDELRNAGRNLPGKAFGRNDHRRGWSREPKARGGEGLFAPLPPQIKKVMDSPPRRRNPRDADRAEIRAESPRNRANSAAARPGGPVSDDEAFCNNKPKQFAPPSIPSLLTQPILSKSRGTFELPETRGSFASPLPFGMCRGRLLFRPRSPAGQSCPPRSFRTSAIVVRPLRDLSFASSTSVFMPNRRACRRMF